MIPEKQLLDDALLSMQAYLTSALPEIKLLSDKFYLGSSSESWNKLSELLEGLMWISQTIGHIREMAIYQNLEAFEETAATISQLVINLEQALTNNDLILIGDILKYEISSILGQLLSNATLTINNEVVRHDLS